MGKPSELSASRSLLLWVVNEFQRPVHVHEIRERCQASLGDSPFRIRYLKQALFELEDKGWLHSSARGFYAVTEKGMGYVKGFSAAIGALGVGSQNLPVTPREKPQYDTNSQPIPRQDTPPIDDTKCDLDPSPADDLLLQIVPLWKWASISQLKARLKRKVIQWLEILDADLVEKAVGDWFIVQLGGEGDLSVAKRIKYDESLSATVELLKSFLKVNAEERQTQE
jgi:hypothetical protein